MRWINWLVGVGVIAGCGITGLGIKDGVGPPPKPSTPQAGTMTSVEGFRLSTYALVRQKNCSTCHNTGTINPLASSDINVAHTEALQNTNFTNPVASMFVTQMMNGHCGSECSTDGTQMQATIEEWKQLAGK